MNQVREQLPTHRQALAYEIESSWLGAHASCELVQRVLGRYFAWKVNQKLGAAHARRQRWDEIKEHYGIKA